LGIVTSLIVLSFLIFFHELGHFLAARFFGVTVHKFSIGFGKEVFSKQFGDTKWQVALIPLGGFVQMKGQDDLDPLKKDYSPDSYNALKPWKRIIILFAGPFANFLTAFVLLFFVSQLGDRTLAPTIGSVIKDSPAYNSKLQDGDKIVKINGIEIKTWKEMSNLIKTSNGSILLTIQRDNKLKSIQLTPKLLDSKSMFGEDIKKKMIGIAPKGDIVTIHYGFFDGIIFALDKTYEASNMIFNGLIKLINGIVPLENVGGVVSIVQVTSQASQSGIIALFTLTALISVNLGILNLLPIPALDGGHIIFNLYELITGKIPNENIMYRLTLIGWVILLGLMLLGLYNDLNRIFG
jgi:regulator of sigma E protease